MSRKIPLLSPDLRRLYALFLGAVLLLFVIATALTGFTPALFFGQSGEIWKFLSEDFLPPRLPESGRIQVIVEAFLTTLAMAMASTTAAALLAFVMALFGSERISPYPKAARFVRGFATFLRNIPTLVWAFILFSSLGIGTGVGFTALLITSFAFMTRAFIETMEDVSSDCVESLLATGASFPERVVHAVLPAGLSGFISWYLYCIEVNIRASTIVGMVGGGGIGLVLFSYIKTFHYGIACSIILMVAAMVIIVDQISGRIRKEILK